MKFLDFATHVTSFVASSGRYLMDDALSPLGPVDPTLIDFPTAKVNYPDKTIKCVDDLVLGFMDNSDFDPEQAFNLTNVPDLKNVPGASISFTSKGETYLQTYGYGDYTEDKTPITVKKENTFRIGSISKTITATVIFMLVDEGKLKTSDLVFKRTANAEEGILFYENIKDERVFDITVHHLLTHTAGYKIGDGGFQTDPVADMGQFIKLYDIELPLPALEMTSEIYDPIIFEKFDLHFEPGTDFQYSNFLFNILSPIIVKVGGEGDETYEDVAQRYLFDGETNKLYVSEDNRKDYPEYQVPGYCIYCGVFPDLNVDENPQDSNAFKHYLGAAGGWAGTAKTLNEFLRRVVRKSCVQENNCYLSENSMKEMETTVIDGIGYGSGLSSSGALRGHSGYVQGSSATSYVNVTSGDSFAITFASGALLQGEEVPYLMESIEECLIEEMKEEEEDKEDEDNNTNEPSSAKSLSLSFVIAGLVTLLALGE